MKTAEKLVYAIHCGEIAYIEKKITTTKYFNKPISVTGNKRGFYLIHFAVECKQKDIMALLIRNYPDLIEAKDNYQQTPLLLAAIRGDIEIVKYLISENANLSAATHWPEQMGHRYESIHWATTNGHLSVVEYLIQQGVDPSRCHTERQFHLIHMAAAAGHLNLVEFLLNEYPELLNKTDAYNRTSLMWATLGGHQKISTYLLSQHANIHPVITEPSHPYYKKNALAIALEKRYFNIANDIISNMPEADRLNNLSPLVKMIKRSQENKPADILDLMRHVPALFPVFAENNYFDSLLSHTMFKNTDNTFIAYTRHDNKNKRHSFCLTYDKAQQVATCFEPIGKELGKGGHGRVRLFKNEKGEPLAVKTPKQDPMYNARTKKTVLYQLEKESALQKIAAPEGTTNIETFATTYLLDNIRYYTTRYLMPYIPGKTVDRVARYIQDTNELALLVLQIAEEVQRLHSRGIIHGDLSPCNIMILKKDNRFFIRIIDFGLAYRLDEKYASNIKVNRCQRTWYAPEVRNQFTAPNVAQDLYSLGYTLNNILSENQGYHLLQQSFPCIPEFIKAAQNIQPHERPDLAFFIQTLSEALTPVDIAPTLASK